MGVYTDFQISSFQEATGIKPATGERGKVLRNLQRECMGIALLLQDEISGIRCGDGEWHGCDPVFDALGDLQRLVLAARTAVYDMQEVETAILMSAAEDDLRSRKWREEEEAA